MNPRQLLSTFLSLSRSLAPFLCAAGVLGLIPQTQAETTSYSGATAITSVPCTISQAGTYYLAADLSINADTPFAINITASNVTLDLNGHTIAQAVGTNNSTIGVYIGGDNVTIRNGTVTGCLFGVDLYGNNCFFEDLSIIAATYRGIAVNGSNHLIRHCRVNNTGGETVPNLAPYALGIVAANGSNVRVMDCDVTTLTPGPGAYTVCIELTTVDNALLVNNRLSAATKGCECAYSSGKYRDNLCSSNVTYTYWVDPTMMIDAGNNQ